MTRRDSSPAPPARLIPYLLYFVVLSLLIVAGGTVPVFADDGETAWMLYDREPSQPVARFAGTPHRVACGSYGVFELDFSGTETFSEPTVSRESGREVPSRYPLLGTSLRHQPVTAGVALSVSSAGSAPPDAASSGGTAGVDLLSGAARQRSEEPAPPPCADGGCFTSPGSEPWVAVVDWDDWHGWSVGQTILQAAGGFARVALFPLNDPYLTTEFGDRITDVHVLRQLCRIAEVVEDPAVIPPVAVNLSFGRLARPWDSVDGECDGSTLPCQIVRVLEHLTTPAGPGSGSDDESGDEMAGGESPEATRRGGAGIPLVVGAAGNHRELLFPASSRPVVATGNLDLPVFQGLGRPLPAWETPLGVQALFPGYGVCLQYEVGRGQWAAWPVPPGSSYATAMMTGWVTPSLVTGQLDPSTARFWGPMAHCRGRRCSLVATADGRPLPRANGAAQRMMMDALDERESCGQAPSGGVEATRALGDPLPLSALPRLSFPAVSPDLQRPAPEPLSCIPCGERPGKGGGRGRGVGQSLDPVGNTAGASHKSRQQGDTLTVEMWAGQSLDPDLVLEEIHLRLGEELLPVRLEKGDTTALTAGDLAALTLDLGSHRLDASVQPSLVWVLRGPTDYGEARFWTSTPILLRR